MNITQEIKKIILESCRDLKLPVIEEEIRIEHPADTRFGDYSCNIALSLAKELKINPKELAEKIRNEIDKNEIIDKVTVAGAGFINFYLKSEFLVKEAEKINYEDSYRQKLARNCQGKIMIIDYSAPNIAKPFGIGHLRSTNIGQAIYNIYQSLGWTCIGDNHIGDWGTQFGKLIVAIKKWNSKKIEELTIEDLEKLYIKFHDEAKKNEELIIEGRDWFSKLEKGDKEALDIWQKCIDISMREYDKVYQLLGVKIDNVHGESFYVKNLEECSEEIITKGITKKSEGAIIVEFKDMPAAMLKKSNGTSTYFTRDMNAVKYRMERWKPNLIIYEVGADQQLHFKQVFETAKMMGWYPSDGMVHVAHGLIRKESGKLSTREGKIIHLSEVIDMAITKADEISQKSEVIKKLNENEKKEIIEKIAIGAIKFSDLSGDPKKDVIFNWKNIMSLDGDSGPYLQYTYARALSVLNKSKIKEQKNIDQNLSEINEDEMALLKEFYKLEEKIIEAASRFSPSVIAEYLLSIARKYNEFYAKNRIINEKEENFRIFLTKTTSNILKKGLKLLGIEVLERM
jgi:arginyl-tRNA synthetase